MSWNLRLDEASWFFGSGRGQSSLWTTGCAREHWLGQWVESWRWTNSQHRKIVSLSPRVEKPKLKEGNKSFVPEPRESSVFRVFFGFLCVWTFYVYYERFMRLYISPIHILVPLSWLCYTLLMTLRKEYWSKPAGNYYRLVSINLILLPDIGVMVRVFANGPGDLGSIPGRVIPKTQDMVLDATLLNTQHYKIRIKGKVEQYRERRCAPLHLGVVAIEKGAFGSPSTTVANFTFSEYYSHRVSHTHILCHFKLVKCHLM